MVAIDGNLSMSIWFVLFEYIWSGYHISRKDKSYGKEKEKHNAEYMKEVS